jgi:hypothetical protein
MSCARRDLCGGRPEPHWPPGLTGEGPFLPRPLRIDSAYRRIEITDLPCWQC